MLGGVIGEFKSITTNEYIRGVKQYDWPPFPGRLWQRNYEHIIRNDIELNRIREYIVNNPAKLSNGVNKILAKLGEARLLLMSCLLHQEAQ